MLTLNNDVTRALEYRVRKLPRNGTVNIIMTILPVPSEDGLHFIGKKRTIKKEITSNSL